jgi:hypothetical protein
MTVKDKPLVAFAMAIGFLMASGPMFAHHGVGNVDTSQLVTLQGTVTEFEMINPHAQISLEVTNDKGKVERWTIEASSPNTLHRFGWDRNTIKPGDRVTVMGYRAKDGDAFMNLRKLVLSNGKELNVIQSEESLR